MRLFSFLAALSVLLLAATCRPDAQTAAQLRQLERTWLHAHEEDQGDVGSARARGREARSRGLLRHGVRDGMVTYFTVIVILYIRAYTDDVCF